MQYPQRKPTKLKLKALLKQLGIPQSSFARRLGISQGTLADLLNWGITPAKGWEELRRAMRQELTTLGASAQAIETAFEHRAHVTPHAVALTTAPTGSIKKSTTKQNARGMTPGRSTAANAASQGIPLEGDDPMLLQKQTLTQTTRKHFGLFTDPFINDITQATDVFISPDIRYVRETLWQHTKHGGLLAIVGESGSGKSTVVSDFKDRLQRESRDVIVVEPSVLYMEENDAKGKTLKSAHIIGAIIATIAPKEPPKRDPEARARQVHALLSAGHRAGQRHVLVIEEAHCLPTPTLKHLKRFAEIRDGLTPLLSIVLVGQPELRTRLAVNNAEVREVAQRCELVELPPLDNHLGEYLKFKFSRIGTDITKVFTGDAIDALRERLTFDRRGSAKAMSSAVSLVYPLAVANAVTAAMNMAAALGSPVVDAAIMKEA